MKQSILVVEDDVAIATLLKYNLEQEGFNVTLAHDGEEALIQVKESKPDLILLDWMLPLIPGIEVCRQLRRENDFRNVPIIMITAKGEEADKLRGLNSGADDYITKPFSPAEVSARIRAVMRRSNPNSEADVLTFGDIVLDTTTFRVKRAGRDIHLGPTEFRLLRHFLENPQRVFSREQLLDAVWGQNVYVEARTVDVHIRRLRKAINIEGCDDIIRTVRSAGYSLDQNEVA
ncbi:MAG: phosphate regulon transcriptional regulatory protein PhoB [Alphaproteobacteria bacterium]|nr:MAG: phosphate regulon transcriptional regulatory protein PhoB [Alphaproteobacteria bacterium]